MLLICIIVCVCVSLQTPEKRNHNGYTNLPDVVQPSHSPTDSASHSSPGKDSVYDVRLLILSLSVPHFSSIFIYVSCMPSLLHKIYLLVVMNTSI